MIGIIAAEEQEVQEIKDILKEIEEICYKNIKIMIGKIQNEKVLVVKSGVGKVNSARIAQFIIDKYDVSEIINLGSAGSINNEINFGDIVIGEELVQHDFDVTAFGREKGFIPETGKFFKSDKRLIEKAFETMQKLNLKENKIHMGKIASGDIFYTNKDGAQKLRNEFGADCVEMEGAAIAQVCFLENIPFISIRSISDSPNGNNNVDFEQYLQMASKRCAEFLEEFVK